MTACGVRNDERFFVASAATRPLLRTGSPLLCSSGVPLGRGEGAKEKPEGAARWIAPRSLPAQGRAVSEPRSVLTKSPGRSRRPRPRGCLFSWLLLFGQAKRSDPLARMASGKIQGRVFWKTRTVGARSKWIPASAGMTATGWIPAFAGMTDQERVRNFQATPRTRKVVPSIATTSTSAPIGRSGPSASHEPSPTRILPRPLMIGSATMKRWPTSLAPRRFNSG